MAKKRRSTRSTWTPLPPGAKAVRLRANGVLDVLRTGVRKLAGVRSRRRNVSEGFYDATGFHPIRRSSDYDPEGGPRGWSGDYFEGGPRKRKKAKRRRRR